MKISALGVLLLAGSTILAACDGNRNYPPPSSATPVASSSGKVPTQADIDACNEYAHNQTKTGTGEVVKDAAIGGVGGAAVGAGGGAIAGGGSGAGKGVCVQYLHVSARLLILSVTKGSPPGAQKRKGKSVMLLPFF